MHFQSFITALILASAMDISLAAPISGAQAGNILQPRIFGMAKAAPQVTKTGFLTKIKGIFKKPPPPPPPKSHKAILIGGGAALGLAGGYGLWGKDNVDPAALAAPVGQAEAAEVPVLSGEKMKELAANVENDTRGIPTALAELKTAMHPVQYQELEALVKKTG